MPSATSPIAMAISWIARPASSEVPAIWREASLTPVAVVVTCPTIPRRSSTRRLNAMPSTSFSERGVDGDRQVAVGDGSRRRSAFSRRYSIVASNDGGQAADLVVGVDVDA